MLNRSETWRQLAANESILMDTRITIDETIYEDVLVPAVTRALMPDSVSIGNAVAAMCTFSLDSNNVIPRSAEILMEMRLTTGGDSPTVSEWLPVGTFFLSRRTKDPINGITAFECYDSMLKANAAWDTTGLTFPVAMNVAAQHIATLIGVEIDSRTTIATGVAYVIDEPAEGTLMRDILATIAGYNGGNWIITPENKLRLVRIDDSGEVQAHDISVYSGNNRIYAINNGQHLVIYSGNTSVFDTEDPGSIEVYSDDDNIYDNSLAYNIDAVIGSVGALPESTITGIRCTYDDGTSYLAGDDTGIVIEASIPGAIATELIERIAGTSYQPFTLTDAFYDPAIELGDRIKYYDLVLGNLASEMITLDGAAQGTISAPDTQEIADEYPYYGQTPKTLAVAKAYAEQAAQRLSDSLTQEDVFNRLTDNGKAKGLFITQDGQLFINASYIYSGLLTLGGLNNENGTLRVLDADGNVVGTWTKDGISVDRGLIQSADGNTKFNLETGEISVQDTTSGHVTKVNSDGIGVYYLNDGGVLSRFGLLSDGKLSLYSDVGIYISADVHGSIYVESPLIALDDIKVPNGAIYGSNDTSRYYHAIKLGHDNDLVMSFYESGGVFNFIRDDSGVQYDTIFQIVPSSSASAAPLGVNNGGTGGTTAAAARTNLGITPANIGAYGVNSIDVSGGLNDNTLYGTAWVNGADVSTLPTTDYYELMCFGNVQLALQYNGSNPSMLYRRYYVNSQWYGWKPVVGLSTSIQINTASWSDIYAKLSVVEGGKSAFFWITDGTVASFISGRSDLAWTSGYVTNVGSGGYRFSAFNASGISYTWVISGLTSASATATVGTVSRSAYDIDLYNNSTSEAVYNELIKIPPHSSGAFTISSTTFGLLTQNKVVDGGGANVVNGTGTVSHVVHTSTSDTFKIMCSGGTTTMPGYMFQWNVTLSKSGTTYTITADNVYGFQYAKAYT